MGQDKSIDEVKVLVEMVLYPRIKLSRESIYTKDPKILESIKFNIIDDFIAKLPERFRVIDNLRQIVVDHLEKMEDKLNNKIVSSRDSNYSSSYTKTTRARINTNRCKSTHKKANEDNER